MRRSVQSSFHITLSTLIGVICVGVLALPVAAQGGNRTTNKKVKSPTVLVAKPAARTTPEVNDQSGKINLALFVLDPNDLAARESGTKAKRSASRSLNLDDTAVSTDTSVRVKNTRRSRETTGMSQAELFRSKNAWKRDDLDGDGVPNIVDRYPFDPSRH